jgi:hypothetical protein
MAVPPSFARQLQQSMIDSVTSSNKLIRLEKRPARIAIRVSKQAKIALFY